MSDYSSVSLILEVLQHHDQNLLPTRGDTLSIVFMSRYAHSILPKYAPHHAPDSISLIGVELLHYPTRVIDAEPAILPLSMGSDVEYVQKLGTRLDYVMRFF